MKKIFPILITTLFYFSPLINIFKGAYLSAQNPLVKQWDYRYGGTGGDGCTQLLQTKDGGFLMAGQSSSDSSGDKTQHGWGGLDYWIVKLDASGQKEWDKRFGTTDNFENTSTALQTSDNGYIIGGTNRAPISGDKTQDSWNGSDDYWIVKIDSVGNKQWDRRYGGYDSEDGCEVIQTNDGGYIIGGSSSSDISGDKTQVICDTLVLSPPRDYWIIKVDSAGNYQWDKDYGGTYTEFLYVIKQTNDGGYILGGMSNSPVGCDKTQSSWGDDDYWIVKVDANGNKQWDKTYGGSMRERLSAIAITADDGFILAGSSKSPVSGNKTQPSKGVKDYWIVKIDSLGNKQWDKDFGASDDDYLSSISVTSDNGFFMCGSSYSNAGGNKTENNLGDIQTWILKTDSLGIKEWDKTIFTTSDYDMHSYGIQTIDGCYAIAVTTPAGIGGYKTQPNWNTVTTSISDDCWIIKFCDTTLTAITDIQNKEFNVNIHPNPFNDYLEISLPENNQQCNAVINDVFGRQIMSQKFSSQNYRLNTGGLAKGIYFLEITCGKQHKVKKIIRN